VVVTLPPSDATTDRVYFTGTKGELSSLLLQANAIKKIPKNNTRFFIKNELVMQDIHYI
jgi:hypothetical protein